jgi:hypothetical protein
MGTQHVTLSSALLTVEDLVAQGHTSFKVFKEFGLWNVIVNGEGK